jgi:hypothetical protein
MSRVLCETWEGWWPIQAWFWLEWGSSAAGQSLPAARSRFRAVHSDSISARPLVLGAPCLAFFARRGKVKPESKIAQNRTWQRRFYHFNVWTEKKRVEKLRSMHRNPVKRGLVKEADDWAWE